MIHCKDSIHYRKDGRRRRYCEEFSDGDPSCPDGLARGVALCRPSSEDDCSKAQGIAAGPPDIASAAHLFTGDLPDIGEVARAENLPTKPNSARKHPHAGARAAAPFCRNLLKNSRKADAGRRPQWRGVPCPAERHRQGSKNEAKVKQKAAFFGAIASLGCSLSGMGRHAAGGGLHRLAGHARRQMMAFARVYSNCFSARAECPSSWQRGASRDIRQAPGQ